MGGKVADCLLTVASHAVRGGEAAGTENSDSAE